MEIKMKKITAILTQLAIIGTLLTFPAMHPAAATRDNIDSFYNIFPIIGEEIKQDGSISRAEFAQIIAGIFERGGINYSGNYAFDDVSASDPYYGAVSTVLAAGCMSGDSGEDGIYHFRPNDAISDDEAVKTLVYMLGYGYLSECYGAYPDGARQAAQRLDLYDGASSGGAVEKISAYVYNALHAYVAEDVESSAKSITYEPGDETYMEKYWDISKIGGVLNKNSFIDINGADAAAAGRIEIDNEMYTSDFSYENVEYLGRYVTAYVYIDGENEGAVAGMFPDSKYDSFVKVNGENIYEINDFSRIQTGESRREKTYTMAPEANVFYNFQFLGPVRAVNYESADVKKALETLGDGRNCEIVLADNNGDGKYDFVWVREYEDYQVESFVSSECKIIDAYDSTVLKMQDAYDSDKIALFKDGRAASVNDIAKNSIVSLFWSGSKENITGAIGYISDAQVSGEINIVGDNECGIDNVKYKIGKRYEKLLEGRNKNVIDLRTGTSSVFYLNAFGSIAGVSSASYYRPGESYVFLIKAVNDMEDVSIKVLNTDGDIVMLQCANSVAVNGSNAKGENVFTRLRGLGSAIGIDPTEENAYIYKLAKIKVNDDGEVTNVEAEVSGSSDKRRLTADLTLSTAAAKSYSDIVYKNSTIGKSVGMSSSTVIFDVPNTATASQAISDENAFSVTSVNNFTGDTAFGISGANSIANATGLSMKFFELDGTRFADVAVRYYVYNSTVGGVSGVPEKNQDCLIVDKVSYSVSDNGENVWLLHGMKSGEEITMQTSEIRDEANPWKQFVTLFDGELESFAGGEDGESKAPECVKPGDVIMTSENARGEIINILVSCRGKDAGDLQWITAGSVTGAGHGNEYLGVNCGVIENYSSGKLVVKEIDGVDRVYAFGSPTITIYNRSKKTTSVGSTNAIEAGKEIYIRQYYSQIKEAVIFED